MQIPNNPIYILVTESNPQKDIIHRVLIEDGKVYGAENLRKYMRTEQEWHTFISLLLTRHVGFTNGLSWVREGS